MSWLRVLWRRFRIADVGDGVADDGAHRARRSAGSAAGRAAAGRLGRRSAASGGGSRNAVALLVARAQGLGAEVERRVAAGSAGSTRCSAKPPSAARPSGSMPISRTGRMIGVAVQLELEHGEDFERRRHGLDARRSRYGSARMQRHLALGIGEAVVVVGLDDDVGEQAVQPVAQLGAEAGHDAVDDDERGHAEHDADDAHQRQVARQQITPAEQQLVHGHLLIRIA